MAFSPRGEIVNVDDLMPYITHLLEGKLYSIMQRLEKFDSTRIGSQIDEVKAFLHQMQNFMNGINNKSRRTNVVFRGLKYVPGEDLCRKIESFCVDVLHIKRELIEIVQIRVAGKENKVFIVTFSNIRTAVAVLNNLRFLKGTTYTVHRDYCFGTRRKKRVMRLIKRELERHDRSLKPTIKGELLILNDHVFEWDHLRGLLCDNEINGCKKLNEITKVDMRDWVNDQLQQEKYGGPQNHISLRDSVSTSFIF